MFPRIALRLHEYQECTAHDEDLCPTLIEFNRSIHPNTCKNHCFRSRQEKQWFSMVLESYEIKIVEPSPERLQSTTELVHWQKSYLDIPSIVFFGSPRYRYLLVRLGEPSVFSILLKTANIVIFFTLHCLLLHIGRLTPCGHRLQKNCANFLCTIYSASGLLYIFFRISTKPK